MQVPFPELENLTLGNLGSSGPVPDSFLGGSAPRLRYFSSYAIPFPGLPKLLLSATHLVELYLHYITHSGYISPEAMATCLSMLTSLEKLNFQFEYQGHLSYSDLKIRRPPPPTRSVLPALKDFSFEGVDEYLEKLLARVDAPRLYRLSTSFFNDIDINTLELGQLISRTPTFGVYNEARFIYYRGYRYILKLQSHPEPSDHGMVEVQIITRPEQLSSILSLTEICTSSLHLLLTMENLYIDEYPHAPHVWGDVEWFDLLHPFTAVKNLYLSSSSLPHIAPALQEFTVAGTTEVLPALQKILLEEFQPSEPVHEDIARFISARQLTNHPVTISVWDRGIDFDD